MNQYHLKGKNTTDGSDVEKKAVVEIVIIKPPHHAELEEFLALIQENGVNVHIVETRFGLDSVDAVILPGSESTVADLLWLRQQGIEEDLIRFVENGGTVAGICGGYQILGQSIADPDHIESKNDIVQALGLLPSRTVFKAKLETKQTLATLLVDESLPSWLTAIEEPLLKGHEIHAGETQTDQPWLTYTKRDETEVSVCDGAYALDGRILGCYLHGLFGNDAFRYAWLQRLGWDKSKAKPKEQIVH